MAKDRSEDRALAFQQTQIVTKTDATQRARALDANLSSLHPGAIFGDYELIRELGRGGMGAVFLARDVRLGRKVAIKFLFHESDSVAQRFLVEARATARCKHDNIVDIYDVGESQGHSYMVLEFLEGRTLATWVKQRWQPSEPAVRDKPHTSNDSSFPSQQVVSVEQALDLIVPVARALAHAHELGIVHRDLKPENIMLTDSGSIKVLDFGIAKMRTETDDTRSEREHGDAPTSDDDPKEDAREDAILGTKPYMSPEQWSAGEIDGRSDIWALGIILWRILTGHHPLSRDALGTVSDLDVPMPSMSEYRPEFGPICTIIDQCLHKRMDDRIPSADALLNRLEPLLRDQWMPANTGEPDNPFAGLAAFQESDHALFFGRERDIISMVTKLRNHPMITVVGPSGTGKSSFVRAGVIPALKQSGYNWQALIVRPGRRPLASLSKMLTEIEHTGAQQLDASPSDARTQHIDTLRKQPGLLGATLRARALRRRARILLFVDQFEELYTLDADRDERAAFVSCLEGAADDASSPVRVLLSLRSDFLDRVAEDRAFTSEITRGLVLLPHMQRDELHQALTLPLKAVAYGFEPDSELVDTMLNALDDTHCALPLMQFTASALWERRDQSRRLLTVEGYHAIGGVAGALISHADQVLSRMSAQRLQLARRILERLVTPERTRAIASVNELRLLPGDADEIEGVLHELADARLVAIEHDENPAQPVEPTGRAHASGSAELVHESLIGGWPTLQRWLEENQGDAAFLAHLRTASRDWYKNDRDPGLLWREEPAEDARRFYKRYSGDLGEQERDYLEAVDALARDIREQETRGQRRKRFALASAFAILAIGLLLVLQLAQNARRERERADVERVRAEALGAESQQRLHAMYQEQGRLAWLFGDHLRALAYLNEARAGGQDSPALRFLLARSAEATSDQLQVLQEQQGMVWSVAFSPDGTTIATGSEQGSVKLWNADDGTLIHDLVGHTKQVWMVNFSPDGSRLISAGWEKSARVWNVETGELEWTAEHDLWTLWGAFHPNGTLVGTASYDNKIKLWDAATGQLVRTMNSGAWVVTATFSADGMYIASGDGAGNAQLWNVETGALIDKVSHRGAITHIALSHASTLMASAGPDDPPRLIPLDGGEPIELHGHGGRVVRVAFSPDDRLLVTASYDTTVKLWDTQTGALVRRLDGHTGAVTDVVFSPDGTRLATLGRDNTAQLWDVHTGRRTWTFLGHTENLWRAAFDLSGERLITAGFDGTARVWRTTMTDVARAVPMQDSDVLHAVFSPDNDRIATTHLAPNREGAIVQVWTVQGERLNTLKYAFKSNVQTKLKLAWSPDGRHLILAGGPQAVVWDMSSGKQIARFGAHGKQTSHAIYTPDGSGVLTSGEDKTAKLWDANTGARRVTFEGHDAMVVYVATTRDGRYVGTASRDRTVRIWDMTTGAYLAELSSSPAHVFNALDFNPDGTLVVTSGEDTTAVIWAIDGRRVMDLEGHSNAIPSVAFSPDGHLVATGSEDGTACIWDVASGAKLWSSERRLERVWSVGFDSTATRLLVAQGNAAFMAPTSYDKRDIDSIREYASCRSGYSLERGRLIRPSPDHRCRHNNVLHTSER